MATKILLRDVTEADLPLFFEQQRDGDAGHMAAFTPTDPSDRDAFMEHWARILGDDTISIQTIVADGQVAGNVLSHRCSGEPEISYWIGKEHWGRGIATEALQTFLERVEARPIYGRAARDNVASLRVLKKCGFEVCGAGKGFANSRGEEVEELVLKLEAD